VARKGNDHLLAAGLFLLCGVVLAFPWLSGKYTVPWDAKAHFQPQFSFLAHALHSGDSPFWNPHVFAGMPQIADPQSLIFAPFFLLAAALVPQPSFQLEDGVVFAMLAMGGLALIGYFRDRGLGAAGALVAALAFAFGGSAAWRIQHTGQVMSLAWLPMTLWLLARGLDRRDWRYGAAAGATAAFMALGRDQIAYLSLLLLAGYALNHILTDARPKLPAFIPLVAGGVVGALILVLPIAMTLELAMNSNRPAIDLDGAFKGSLPPGSLLTLISANMFGTDGPLADFWGPPSAAFGTSDIYLARNMTALYLGELPIFAIIAAFGARFFSERDMRFFAGAAVFFLLYALGRYAPAFELFYHIPGVDLWRRPADATFLLCAVLAILGGYGFDLVLRGDARVRPGVLIGAGAVLLALAVGVAYAKGHLAQAAAPLVTSAAFVLLAIGVLIFAGRANGRGLAVMLVAAATLTADLAIGNEPNESTALPPDQFDVLRENTGNETIALLKARLAAKAAPDRRDRVELAAIDFHWPNASLTHGFDHDLGYNPIRIKLFEDVTGAGDHVALPDQRNFSKLYPRYRSPLSDLLGLRYVAAGVPLEQIDKTYKSGDFEQIARTKDAYVYENKHALPRVLLPTCALRVGFDRMIEDGGWPEVDFRETVLLEESPICHTHAGVAAQAKIASYRNTEVVVQADVPPGGGWVVLNDVWHPWWFATLDGEETRLLRANVLFRAVAVPEGKHEVRFAFHPLRGLLREMRGGK